MNYIDFVEQQLNSIKYDLGIENKIVVAEEQAFVKIIPEPSNIYVVVKYLSSTLAYDGKIQPVQFMILSEDNSLNLAQALFNKFTTTNNLTTVTLNGDLVKQTYETPVVVSNYNAVGYGFKSLLYVSGLLYILENIIDIDKITYTYDTGEDDFLEMYISSFNMVYAMTGNTQPISTQKIATTVKSVSTLTCSFVLPMISKYSVIIDEILKIMNGTSSGNTSFNLSFTLGGENFSFEFKLVSASFTTAPNSAPGLQLGFMV